jgi:putative transposase
MRKSRFREEQIIAILREQESGVATAEVCRRHGISSATFFKWKAKYGGLDVSAAPKLKALEDENAKLKKLLAEAMLDITMLKDLNAKKMMTPAVERQAVAHLVEHHGVSQRRACRTLKVPRSSMRYRFRRPKDAKLRQRLKALANERRRFGYRRLHQILRRERWDVGLKKVRRLYAEERLQVRRRKGRKKAQGVRVPAPIPQGPNQR